MNKKQALLDVMDGKPTGKVPGSFWFHFSGERAEGEGCVKAHLDYYRASGIDYIKIMSDGCGYRLNTGIAGVADWKKVKAQGRGSPYFTRQLERAKRIADGIRGECCLFYNIFVPFSIVRDDNAGDALVMAHLKEDRKAVMDAMAVVAEDVAELAGALITEAGCTGIYMSLQGGERNRFTAEEYAAIVKPSDLLVLDAANRASPYNIAHLCGWAGDRNRLEIWKDYPAKVFNWAVFVEGMDIEGGRKLFPGKTLMGGFDNRKVGLLYGSSDETIKAYTRDLVKRNGKQGTIVGADCTLPADIDVRRIRLVMDTLREIG